jgi:competence protein ComEA
VKRIFEIGLGLVIGLLVGLLIGVGLFLTARAPSGTAIELIPTSSPEPIVVYVLGAVERPGIYTIPRGSRLIDAVQAAGGFIEGAEIADLNVAVVVEDGERIEIPGSGELPTPVFTIGESGLVTTATPNPDALIDINTADAALLDTLPGVGPTTAQKIIEYREENGPFTRVDDLLKVPGIGPSTLEQIRSLVTVGGEGG